MSTKHGTIYLCGPITGETFEAAKFGWRQKVYYQLGRKGILCLSPLRHLKPEQVSEGDTASMSPMGATAGVLSTPRGLTQRDKFDTKRSDIIFCNLIGATKISAGSMIEFGWADAWNIPVLTCMEEGNVHDHAMVRALSSWIVPTLDEGIGIVQDLLVPNL